MFEGGFFRSTDVFSNVRVLSPGFVIDLGVEHSEDVCDHTMFIDFDSSHEITAVNVGEPDLDLPFFIDADLLFINTEESDYLAELHISVDTSFVEMKDVRIRDVLDL